MMLIQRIFWLIGLVINFIILFTYRLEETDDSGDVIPTDEESRRTVQRKLVGHGWEKIIDITSVIFAAVSLSIFLCWILFKFRISYEINMKQHNQKNPSRGKNWLNSRKQQLLISAKTIFKTKHVVSFLLHSVFCVAGIFLNPFFHTLHLLLIFNISSTAMYILEASTSRLGALAQTFVVAVFFIYSYSTLQAYFYSEKTGDNIGIDVCKTLTSCFMYSLSIGLRYSIADMMNPYNSESDNKFVTKVFFDLSFYILVNTIIVNIVFGIIVDTFGSMRDEEFSRKEMMQSTCLICLNSKKDIQESQ